ncbi:MAG: CdaR family protein [Patescibacteria group bacterium]
MKIVSIFSKNWHIKTLAILVSLFLWMYAATVKTSVKNFPAEIPVSAINLTPGYVAILEKDTVSISISAETGTWNKLSSSSFSAYVDLAGLTPGTHSIAINVATQVSGVSIVSKNPSVMNLTIEPAIEKDVPVTAKIVGNTAENMVAGDVIFSPNVAKLSGPKSLIDGIGQATVEIVLNGERESFSKSVILSAEDSKGNKIRNITFVPKTVSAQVLIVAASNVKSLGIKVITAGSLAPGYSISSIVTDPSTATIYGSAEAVRLMNSVPTQAIDISSLSKSLSANTNLNLPLGVKTDGSPEIKVTIVVIKDLSAKSVRVPISSKNLAPGLRISSITPNAVDVIVSGPAEKITNLSVADLSITLDLAGFGSGTFNFTLNNNNFSGPTGITLLAFSVQEVSVLIE